MTAETLTILKTLIEEIREDGTSEGVISLGGPGVPADALTVSLARFQSYRGRTTAALLEELEDFVLGASKLQWSVDDILVHLTVW